MELVNGIYIGANQRESLIDIEIPQHPKGLILFVHGYKGFKDWGAWHLVQKYFVRNHYGFAKMNLSHNGGTTENPIDFPDETAFGNNRYTYELADIEAAISFVSKHFDLTRKPLMLLGHSRGGGMVLLSGNHPKVSSIVTWASISDIENRFPKGSELVEWQNTGKRTVLNARTKQSLPHFYSFYEDWLAHKEQLNISNTCKLLKQLDKKCLHVHGTADEAVNHQESVNLAKWTGGKLELINHASHTFGCTHPWTSNELPNDLEQACQVTLNFISQAINGKN